jgi:hypothetical protein
MSHIRGHHTRETMVWSIFEPTPMKLVAFIALRGASSSPMWFYGCNEPLIILVARMFWRDGLILERFHPVVC